MGSMEQLHIVIQVFSWDKAFSAPQNCDAVAGPGSKERVCWSQLHCGLEKM